MPDGTTLGIRRLLATAARIYLGHFPKIALVGAAVYLPIEALVQGVDPNEVDPIKAYITTWQLRALPDLLFGILALAIVIRLTANAVSGESTRLRTVWSQVAGRYLAMVPTSVAASLVVSGLFILLVVPGLVGMVYLTFYLQVPALRSESGFVALKHSKAIVEGRFWRVAGYNVLFMIGVEAALSGTMLASDLVGSPYAAVAIRAAGDVLALYFTVAFTVLYLHLEATRFDH